MSRHTYGGSTADWLAPSTQVTDDLAGPAPRTVLVFAGGTVLQVWSDRLAGDLLTSLLDSAGDPAVAVTTTADGEIPLFSGPDGYAGDVFVADPATGLRYRLAPSGLATRVTTLETAVGDDLLTLATPQTVTGTKTLDGADPAKTPLTITRDADVTPDSAPLVVSSYKGVPAVWLSPWGGLRIRVPATPELGYGDVGVKLFGRAESPAIAQIWASTDDETAPPSWQVVEGDQTVKAVTAAGLITAAAAGSAAATISGGSGAWQPFTGYANGYSAYASTVFYTPAGRITLGGQLVKFRGRIVTDGTIAAGETICVLPPALRPEKTAQVSAVTSAGSPTQLDINPDGTLVNQRALTATWIALDGAPGYFIGSPTGTAPPVTVGAPGQALHLHMYAAYFDGAALTTRYKALINAIAALNTAQPGTISRVRLDVGWSTFQQNSSALPPDDNFYLAQLMNTLIYLNSVGLKAYLTLHQSPRWARASQIPPPSPTAAQTALYANVKQLPDITTPNMNALTAFAGWIVDKTAAYVDEYDWWNEPNLTGFSGTGRNTAAWYMPTLNAFSAGAHGHRPACQVMAPGVSKCDWKWVADCYALGLASVADIISVHPYQGRQSVPPESTEPPGGTLVTGWEKERIALGLPKLIAAMAASSHNVPIWMTETGWGADDTDQGGPAGGVSVGYPTRDVGAGLTYPTLDAKSADFHGRTLALLARTEFPQVRLYTAYQVHDSNQPHPPYAAGHPTAAEAHQAGFEFFTDTGGRKPQAQKLIDFRAAHQTVRALY